MPTLARKLIKLLPQDFRDQYRQKWTQKLEATAWHFNHLLKGRRLPDSGESGARIHLGCGKINIPGYINVDAYPHPHVHYRSSLDRLPMFPDGSASFLYASHCLEHFPYREVPKILKEWVRVLRPGGVLRVAVPDFNAILLAYEASQRNIASVIGPLLGGQDYPLNFHFAAFTHAHLVTLLTGAGLEQIRTWSPGESQWSPTNDCASASLEIGGSSFPVSLNLEGSKTSKQP